MPARDSAGRFSRGAGQSKAIGDDLRKALATVVKATALEIDANLRMAPDEGGTPVDTGHARANWIPSVGQPSELDVEGSTDAAHDAGVARVASYRLENGSVFVSNAAPYIERLNNGSSKQAPAMFVETAIDRALVTMEQKFGARAIPVDDFRSAVGGAGAENMASAYSPFAED